MATRSTIGIVNPDNTVTAVYCHWDGYPEYNGKILRDNYTNQAIVRELVELGSISSLGAEIGSQHPFSKYELKAGEVYDEKLYENWTTFYGRDRGEAGQHPKTFKDVAEFVREFGEEYNYLFVNDVWFVNDHGLERNGQPVFDTVKHALQVRESQEEMA